MPKEFITSLAVFVSGISMLVLSSSSHISLLIGMMFMQGLGFGLVDTMGNVVFTEVWLLRVQPWMQALHTWYIIIIIIIIIITVSRGSRSSRKLLLIIFV